MHELSSGDHVKLLRHGQNTDAVAVEMPTGVELRDVTGRNVPAAEIDRIDTTSHGRGALDGLAWGALSGAVLGGVLGYSGGDDDCGGDGEICILDFSASDKAVLGAIGLGAVGGLLGLLVGAAVGATDIYEYPQAVVKPVGPPGSVAGATFSF